jgi:O-antigen/teichoic acid export membrane protein
VSDFLETVTVAAQDIHLSVLFTVTGQLARGALLIVAALVFSTLGALLAAAALQALLLTVVLLWYVHLRFPGALLAFDRRLFATQLSYALPFGLAGLAWRLEMDVHHYVVARRFGPAAYAIYAVGCFQLPLLGILRDAVNSVLMPRVSLLQHRAAKAEIRRLVVAAARKLAAAHWPAYAYLIVMGREVLTVLFTDQYRDSWPIFAINLTLVLLGALTPTDAVLRAYAEQRKFLLRLRCVSLFLLAAGLWWAVPRRGMLGAVSVVVLIGLFENAWIVYRVARLLDARASDWKLLKDFPKLAAAAGAAALCVGVGRAMLSPVPPLASLALTAPVFAALYAGFVWASGVPTAEEKDAARRLLLGIRNRQLWFRKSLLSPSEGGDNSHEDQDRNSD